MKNLLETYSLAEINKLIEGRLYSNNYGDFSLVEVNTYTNSITLSHDACKNIIITTLEDIEEGTLECKACRAKKLLDEQAFLKTVNYFSKELIKNKLQLFKENEDIYIKCKKCKNIYWFESDFDFQGNPDDFSCSNPTCHISLMAPRFDATHIETHNYDKKPLATHPVAYYRNDSGFVHLKCKRCKKISVVSLEKAVLNFECFNCFYLKNSPPEIDEYNEQSGNVTLICKYCGTKYNVSTGQFEDEDFDCPRCNS